MSDGARDALTAYIRAGMPRDNKVGKPCPHCGKWSYTRNQCHPEQGLFCSGSPHAATTLQQEINKIIDEDPDNNWWLERDAFEGWK